MSRLNLWSFAEPPECGLTLVGGFLDLDGLAGETSDSLHSNNSSLLGVTDVGLLLARVASTTDGLLGGLTGG